MHGRRPTIASTNGVVAAAHPLAARPARACSPRRQRLRRGGGHGGRAQRGRALHVGARRPGPGDLLGRGRAAHPGARLRAARAVRSRSSASKRARIWRGGRSPSARRAISPAGPSWWRARPKAAGRALRAGDRAGARRLPARRVQRRGDQRARAGARALSTFHPRIRAHLHGGGDRVEPGRVLKQPDLARTLERIAAEGPSLLYGGALGQSHRRASREARRLPDHGRSGAVEPRWKDPIAVAYRGRSVHVPPPPCEGFQFLLTLRILEGFDLAKLERNGVEHLDTVCRAIRLGGRRAHRQQQSAPEKLAEPARRRPCRAACAARVRDGRPIAGPTEQWIGRRPAAEDPATPPRSRSPTATATSSASRRASAARSAAASSCRAPASASTISSTGPR